MYLVTIATIILKTPNQSINAHTGSQKTYSQIINIGLYKSWMRFNSAKNYSRLSLQNVGCIILGSYSFSLVENNIVWMRPLCHRCNKAMPSEMSPWANPKRIRIHALYSSQAQPSWKTYPLEQIADVSYLDIVKKQKLLPIYWREKKRELKPLV